MIELLYELFGEVSPLYLYFSIMLSIVCAYRFVHVEINKSMMDNYIYTRECHAQRIRLLPKREPIGENKEIHNWITHTTKRIDAPDDDTDKHFFSFIISRKTKRGGKQCNIKPYSLFSRNIALSGLFY